MLYKLPNGDRVRVTNAGDGEYRFDTRNSAGELLSSVVLNGAEAERRRSEMVVGDQLRFVAQYGGRSPVRPPSRAVQLATGNSLIVRQTGTDRIEVETRNPAGETISTVVRSGDAARRLLITLAAAARR